MKDHAPSASESWVEINLSHLRDNYQSIKNKVKSSARIMAVVKADAYGHGLVPIARALIQLGVPALGVGSLEEGIQIRKKVSSTVPVVLLLGCTPAETAACLSYHLTPVLYTWETAQRLDQVARRKKITIPIHLKIDTGMGRLGVPWTEFQDFMIKTASLKSLKITGLTSHFGQADVKNNYNQLQWKRFAAALDMARGLGLELTENHMANSSALLNYRQSLLHFIRPGILLFGYNPTDPGGQGRSFRVKPVMALKSRILQVKEVPAGVEVSYGGTYITSQSETLAVVPTGYANGYPRILSNRSQVLIRGRRFPVIGRVCMNLIVVRVMGDLQCQAGEEVVLMGDQGRERITADELAQKAETISYELLCLLGRLNPRKYLSN